MHMVPLRVARDFDTLIIELICTETLSYYFWTNHSIVDMKIWIDKKEVTVSET